MNKYFIIFFCFCCCLLFFLCFFCFFVLFCFFVCLFYRCCCCCYFFFSEKFTIIEDLTAFLNLHRIMVEQNFNWRELFIDIAFWFFRYKLVFFPHTRLGISEVNFTYGGVANRGILDHIFCLISISILVSDGATDIIVLIIEIIRHE